jgi:transposase-like protein
MKKIDVKRKEEFLFLYSQKLNDYDIAERMNISDSTIFRWRKESNLPPNHTRIKSINKKIEPTQE